MELGAGAGLRGQGGIDFGFAHLNAALAKTLAQALDGDFIADRAAEFGERHAVGFDALAQAIHIDAILLGNAVDGVVELFVADADAALGRGGDLQLHQHQAFQHLALQYVAWRQLTGLVGVLRGDVVDRTVEFALQHHVFVDHGGNAVQWLQGLCGNRCHQQGGKHAGKDQSGSHSHHGIVSGPEALSSGSGVVLLGGTR